MASIWRDPNGILLELFQPPNSESIHEHQSTSSETERRNFAGRQLAHHYASAQL